MLIFAQLVEKDVTEYGELNGTRKPEEWRRLHNNELYALYPSQSTVRVITSRKTRWGGHVTRIGETKGAYMVFLRKPDGRTPLVRSWR
jgi:hypothetical protein